MEIPSISSSGGNPFLVNYNPINAPYALPEKTIPLPEEKVSQKQSKETTVQNPDQAPKTPVFNKSIQSFSNVLKEIGLQNTPENNQLANVLANYGQPVNKQTMTQVSRLLTGLVNGNNANIEAGVVLLINNLKVEPKSISAVRQLLTGGGMSQNLLVLNKDLKKMIDKLNDNDFTSELNKKITSNKELRKKETIKGIDPDIQNENNLPQVQNIKKQDAPIQEVKQLIKGEKDQSDVDEENKEPSKNSFKENDILSGKKENNIPKNTNALTKNIIKNEQNTNKSVILNNNNNIEQKNIVKNLNVSHLPSENNIMVTEKSLLEESNPQNIIKNLGNNVQKLSNIINTITNLDILQNPHNFPQQISMLKKYFSDMELTIEELKDIIDRNFPELKSKVTDGDDEENSFIGLLQNLFMLGEEEKKTTKKTNLANLNNTNDNDLMKELSEKTEDLNDEFFARELLAKSEECLCIPIPVNINGKIYNAEIMIRREDKSNKKIEIGEIPLKINLAVNTNNLGKIGVDISNLKRDLQINFNVADNSIKNKVDKKIKELEMKLNKLPFDIKALTCRVELKEIERNSLLLPQKYKVMSMNRIDGVV
ncbi:MAG: hypothetical protein AABZ74_13345 [Cyanobacteriota bacterium]